MDAAHFSSPSNALRCGDQQEHIYQASVCFIWLHCPPRYKITVEYLHWHVVTWYRRYCCLPSPFSFFYILLWGPGWYTVEVSRSQSACRTPLNEWSAGRFLRNKKQTQETYIHAISGFRTRDPSPLAAADQHLRPHGYWEPPNRLSLQFQ
jgi:hypothetical protein